MGQTYEIFRIELQIPLEKLTEVYCIFTCTCNITVDYEIKLKKKKKMYMSAWQI